MINTHNLTLYRTRKESHRLLFKKLMVTQLVNKFSVFYGSHWFTAMLTGNSTLPIQKQLKSVLLRSFSILPFHLGITSNHVHLQKFWKFTQLGTAFFSIITIMSLNSDIITVRVQNVNFKIPFSGFLKAITKLVGTSQF
jgi:hypothetical protein